MKASINILTGTDVLPHLQQSKFTSLVKGCELQYTNKLRIYLPKGTSAVYKGDINYRQDLYEVDIQHGAQLKIISIDSEYINCLLIKTA